MPTTTQCSRQSPVCPCEVSCQRSPSFCTAAATVSAVGVSSGLQSLDVVEPEFGGLQPQDAATSVTVVTSGIIRESRMSTSLRSAEMLPRSPRGGTCRAGLRSERCE